MTSRNISTRSNASPNPADPAVPAVRPEEIRKHIIPHYNRIADLVHSYDKPFLLHSCGKIYDVMGFALSFGFTALPTDGRESRPDCEAGLPANFVYVE
jgi:hypothetical protein